MTLDRRTSSVPLPASPADPDKCTRTLHNKKYTGIQSSVHRGRTSEERRATTANGGTVIDAAFSRHQVQRSKDVAAHCWMRVIQSLAEYSERPVWSPVGKQRLLPPQCTNYTTGIELVQNGDGMNFHC